MKLPRFNSLRTRLIATYVLALFIATAAVFALVLIILGRDKQGLTSRGLAMQAKWITQGLEFDAQGRPTAIAAERSPWVYQSAPRDLKYRVLNASGQVLLASDVDAAPLTAAGRSFEPQQPMFQAVVDGIPLYVLTVAVPRPEGMLFIQTARSERIDLLARRALIMPMVQVAVWVEVGSLALFALAVYFTLSRLLVSLKEASTAASRIEPVNLSARLSSDHLPSEMSPLIDAFNLALGRLEQGYQVQKSFLEGAAHELKTPLALIRAQIELSSGSDRAALLQDVDLMARQVHQLLHLAEVSEAQNYVYAPTEVAAVAREVIDHLYRLAERRSVSLQLLAPDEEIRAKADRSALFVLLKNLTENAIRHSPTGGVVSLHVDTNCIEVRDQGEGIDEEDFPHLFERFWHGGAERESGAGLGLAICREIARVHGWSLDAHNSKPGAIFRLRFDAAPHDLASES